jgi:hypothetical protein
MHPNIFSTVIGPYQPVYGKSIHKIYMTDNRHYVNRFSPGRKGREILNGE